MTSAVRSWDTQAGRAVRVLMALVVSALLVVVGSLLNPATAGATAPMAPVSGTSPMFGVQFHGTWQDYTDSQRAQVLDTLRDNGAQSVRIDVSWRMLEPDAPGVFSPWGLRTVDNAITMAASRGLRPLVTVWMTPKWATGSDDERVPPTSPAALAAFTDLTNRLADRYDGVVDGWEIWNEPNSPDFMRGADPVVYAKVLAAGYAGVKAGSPSTPVVFGGPMFVDDVWVSKVLAAGAAGKYDVMGVHPYQAIADEAPEVPDDGTKWRMNHLPALLQVMAAHGDAAKPIWFTEFGWSVHPTKANAANWERGVSQAVQADYLVRTLEMVARQYPSVTRVYWYNDRATTADPNNTGYGLVNTDGTPVPALSALGTRPATTTGSVLVPTRPTQVYDSRWSPDSGVATGLLRRNSSRQVSITNGRDSVTGRVATPGAVPAGATAIAYNITVDSAAGSGWLRVSPGTSVGAGSAINWSYAGQQIANGLATGTDSTGLVTVTSGGGGDTHFIIDVVGYFVPAATAPQGGVLNPITPVRAYDSRNVAGGRLAAGATATIPVAAAAGLPAGASAIAYNITAANTTAGGYLAVAPGNSSPAGSSSVNWTRPGDVVANGLIVGVDERGAIRVQAGPSGADFIVDVVGYYTPAVATPQGAKFFPLTPERAYDSRSAQPAKGALPAGSSRWLSIRDGRDAAGIVTAPGVVPVGARAVTFNATVTNTSTAGYLSLNPGDADDSAGTATSTLNWSGTGVTVANSSIVGVDANGGVNAYAGASATDVIVDVMGYYK